MKRIKRAEIKYGDLQVTYEDGSTSSRGLSIFNGEPYIASQTMYTVTIKQSGSNSYNEELTAIYDSNLQERRQGTYSPDRLKDIEETLLSEIERDNEYEASKQAKQESKPASKQNTYSSSSRSSGLSDKDIDKIGDTLDMFTVKCLGGIFVLIIVGWIIAGINYAIHWVLSPFIKDKEPAKQEKIIEQPKQKQEVKQEQSVQKQEPPARKVAYQPKLSDLDENQKVLVPYFIELGIKANNISKEQATKNAYLMLYYCDVNTELATENERISDCMVQYKAAVEDGHVFED